jgi:hypothetical protein
MTEAASPIQPAIPVLLVKRGIRHTGCFVIALYSLAFEWGLRNIYFWQPSMIDLIFPVAFAIVLGWWAIVDARRRRHPIPLLARQWFFLLAGLLVPVYVIWSRGWHGVGWLVLHAVLWFVVATVVMFVGGVIVFGNEWLRGLGM